MSFSTTPSGSSLCKKDALFQSIERSLNAMSSDELSAMVRKKVTARFPSSDTLNGQPLVVGSRTLATMIDACITSSMRIDEGRAAREGGSGNTSSSELSSHQSASVIDGMLWRCTLCGESLIRKPIFSCEAPMRTDPEAPRASYHHFCDGCHSVLALPSRPRCPKCDRNVSSTRNLNAEMQCAFL